MWSKLKHYLKKKAVRTMADFHQALLEAFETLTDYDFEAWFVECGYVVSYIIPLLYFMLVERC